MAELRAILAANPLFSPLPELCLKTDRVLGRGGQGVVYLVRDTRLGREAALKLVGDGRASLARRFLREAAITTRLDHPGIPPVYDAGKTSSGQAFLLMRFVAGESLEEILKARSHDRSALLGILIKIAEAVAYAHSRRVVHRDLKPANIMVGAFGEVLVMDWGLARNFHDAEDDVASVADEPAAPPEPAPVVAPGSAGGVTRAGAIVGTLGYMSKEQARGEEVDGRTDVFALGSILVEVLSGEPAITGSSDVERLVRSVAGTVVLPDARRGALPAELVAIAAKALAAEPGDRYAKATDLAADLRAYLEGRRVSVHRYTAVEQARGVARRHPVFVASSLVAVLLASLAAVLLAFKNVEIERKNAALEAEKRERLAAQGARERAERARLLLADAGARFHQGAPSATVAALVARAVSEERSEAILLEGARLLVAAREDEAARRLLRACADEFPPGYGALFTLHTLSRESLDFGFTPPLQELVARAHARGDTNVFTMLADFVDANRKGEIPRARAAAERACELAPKLDYPWIARARSRWRSNDYEGALADLTTAIGLNPRQTVAWNERSDVRGALGDLDGSLADAERAVALAPEAALPLARRSFARQRRDDLDGALADALEATRREENLPAAWLSLGFARLSRARGSAGELQEAEAAATRAIALDPSNASAHILRARVRIARRDSTGAIEDAERALAASKNLMSYDALAQAHALRGDAEGRQRAVEDCTAGLALDGGSASSSGLWSLLEELLEGDGRTDELIAAATSAIAAAPREARHRIKRAHGYHAKRQWQASIADCQAALELDPAAYDAWITRGAARCGAKDFAGAISDATEAARLAPRAATPYVNRAVARNGLADHEGVARDCDEAIARGAEVEGYRMRGLARAAMGQREAARADLEKALALGQPPGIEALLRARLAELAPRK